MIILIALDAWLVAHGAGIKLQQLSLLVAGLLAACGACLAGGWLLLPGGLLGAGDDQAATDVAAGSLAVALGSE